MSDINQIIEEAVTQRFRDTVMKFIGDSYYGDTEFNKALKKAVEGVIAEEVAKRESDIRAALQKSIDEALPQIDTRIVLTVNTGRR